MTNLKRICNEVIDVADKNPGLPWELNIEHQQIWEPKSQLFITCESDYPNDETIELILIAVNHAHKLARALLVMAEALRKIELINKHGQRDDWQLRNSMEDVAMQALAQAEEILK